MYMYMKYIYWLLFSLASSSTFAYQYLECGKSQQSYLDKERDLFGLGSLETPFFNKGDFGGIYYIPTACAGAKSDVDTNTSKYLYNLIDNPIPHNTMIHIPFVSSLFNMVTNTVWSFCGWEKRTYYNEQYWFYNNPTTDNIVVFFHGLNGLNGLENMYLLSDLTTNASVYMSLYPNTFLANNNYNHTYSEHIDNVIQFMQTEMSDKQIAIVGNSYGSIRATTICKRYDCSHISKIVLTDVITVNLPFHSFKLLFYGIFFENELTSNYNSSITIQTLKQEKHYNHMLNSLDWYEWNVDSYFMNYYRNNLVLIMGDYDKFVRVNKTSYALTQLCRVIYTPTRHGMVLLSNVLDSVTMF